jgi:hypothetical protein
MSRRGDGTVRGVHPLRVEREHHNLTQEGLASRAALSSETIRRAEPGLPIGLHSRGQLCEFFQRTPEELGLVPAPTGTPAPGSHIAEVGAEDMNRRGLLGLLNVAGAAL